MSRTEYVASKPTSELPFPRTRLLGTCVARQSYNSARAEPTTHPHHHVTQTSTHSGSPNEVWRARAARACDHAAFGTGPLGRGHEQAPGAARGAHAAVRRAARRARAPEIGRASCRERGESSE